MSNNNQWKIVQNFLNQKKDNSKNSFLVSHHISSFEYFIEHDIPFILEQNNPYIVKKDNIRFTFNITNPRITRVTFKNKNGKIEILTPFEAINRGISYNSDLLVDIEEKVCVYDEKEEDKIIHEETFVNKNEIIAQIPIMVKSKFCSLKNAKIDDVDMCLYDNGGYFIINGNEKVIVCQERMCDNKAYVFNNKSAKHLYSCDIRSNTSLSRFSQLLSLQFYSNENISGECNIRFFFPHLNKPQPLFLLFKYFDYDITDKEIISFILGNNIETHLEYKELLIPSMLEYKKLNIGTREQMLEYLNVQIKPNVPVDIIMKKDILPHLKDNVHRKIFFIASMVKDLLDTVIKKRKVADRDHFKNKRIETSGILLSQVFRTSYETFLNELRSNTVREITKNKDNYDIIKFVKKSSTITNTIKYSLATGVWNNRNKNNKKIGVSQVLSRLTYISTLSHLRRINAPIGRLSKIIVPRKLHNSQMMYMCAAETPEGHTVGLVKNLTIASFITNEYSDLIVLEILNDLNMTPIEKLKANDYDISDTKIYVNGAIVGVYKDNTYELETKLKLMRRKLIINPEISISFVIHTNSLIIYTDRGRVTRPLVSVQNNKPVSTYENIAKLSWYENIKAGNIEYIDVEESETCMIAMTEKDLMNTNIEYTHLEIHPALMLGVSASLIPLPNHNQSPRNIYQSSMCKQAIGVNSTNFLNRMDTSTHFLHYPQKPLVYSEAADILGFNDLPAGQNIIIAIASHSGYNQEDSVILNRGAIERGLFQSTYYRSYKLEEKKNMTAMAKEKFCIPDKETCMNIKYGSYDKLDKNGLVREGSFVTDKDVIIGKITPILDKNVSTSKKDLRYTDSSILIKHNESGIVDKVITTYNGDEYKVAKVRIRTLRTPQIGDKFASRQG